MEGKKANLVGKVFWGMERWVNGGNLSLGRYFGDGGRMIAYDGGLGMRMKSHVYS